MEAIGSFFFILVLLAGVLFLFKGRKKTGAILVAIAFVFLYIIPLIVYDDYKEGYYGTYESNAGKILIIYDDNTYAVYANKIRIDTSSVSFMNIDDGYVVFDGIAKVTTKNGSIISTSDSTEIFRKISNE